MKSICYRVYSEFWLLHQLDTSAECQQFLTVYNQEKPTQRLSPTAVFSPKVLYCKSLFQPFRQRLSSPSLRLPPTPYCLNRQHRNTDQHTSTSQTTKSFWTSRPRQTRSSSTSPLRSSTTGSGTRPSAVSSACCSSCTP